MELHRTEPPDSAPGRRPSNRCLRPQSAERGLVIVGPTWKGKLGERQERIVAG